MKIIVLFAACTMALCFSWKFGSQAATRKLCRLKLTGTEATEVVVAVASAGLLFRLGVYFNMQLETAKLMSGIVAGSKVVELSSKESKNIYYLPHNVSFIAVSGVGEEKNGIEKGKALNNYGKILNNVVDVVNRDGLNIRSQVRATAKDLPRASAGFVLSLGALQRAQDVEQRQSLLDDAFRIVRPGGSFLFVEPNKNNKTLELVLQVLDSKKIDTSKGKAPPRKRRMVKQYQLRQSDTSDSLITSATTLYDITASSGENATSEIIGSRCSVPTVEYKNVQNIFLPYVVGTIRMPV